MDGFEKIEKESFPEEVAVLTARLTKVSAGGPNIFERE